jgi:hypothetical protein
VRVVLVKNAMDNSKGIMGVPSNFNDFFREKVLKEYEKDYFETASAFVYRDPKTSNLYALLPRSANEVSIANIKPNSSDESLSGFSKPQKIYTGVPKDIHPESLERLKVTAAVESAGKARLPKISQAFTIPKNTLVEYAGILEEGDTGLIRVKVTNSPADVVYFTNQKGENIYFIKNRLLNEQFDETIRKHKQAIARGGQIMVEATSFVRRDEAANPESDSESRIDRFLQWAKDSGFYLTKAEYLEKYGEEYMGRGFESKVYLSSKNRGYVFKTKRFALPVPNPRDVLDSIVFHNALFPETAYEIVGVTEDTDRYGENHVTLAVKQLFIKGRPSTAAEVEEALKSRGYEFFEGNRNLFIYDGYIVGDVSERTSDPNAITSESGKVYFIDPWIQVYNTSRYQAEQNPQKLNRPQTPIEIFQALIGRLKQNGLAREVYTTRDQMIEYLRVKVQCGV